MTYADLCACANVCMDCMYTYIARVTHVIHYVYVCVWVCVCLYVRLINVNICMCIMHPLARTEHDLPRV